MGTYGASRPKRKRHNYRFVPRPKKEQLPAANEGMISTMEEPLIAETAETTESKPKRKAPAKKPAKKKEE